MHFTIQMTEICSTAMCYNRSHPLFMISTECIIFKWVLAASWSLHWNGDAPSCQSLWRDFAAEINIEFAAAPLYWGLFNIANIFSDTQNVFLRFAQPCVVKYPILYKATDSGHNFWWQIRNMADCPMFGVHPPHSPCDWIPFCDNALLTNFGSLFLECFVIGYCPE